MNSADFQKSKSFTSQLPTPLSLNLVASRLRKVYPKSLNRTKVLPSIVSSSLTSIVASLLTPGERRRHINPLEEVERSMRTLGKAICTAHLGKKNWKEEMNVFLRQYRATPDATTDLSPSEALNGRKLEIFLLQLPEVSHFEAHYSIHEKDCQKKKEDEGICRPAV